LSFPTLPGKKYAGEQDQKDENQQNKENSDPRLTPFRYFLSQMHLIPSFLVTRSLFSRLAIKLPTLL
jgi:hypothetical protein